MSIEVRLRQEDLQHISQRYHVEVVTPDATRPFTLPEAVVDGRRAFGSSRYKEMFQMRINEGNLRAVDHGEFRACAKRLVDLCAQCDEGPTRNEVVCLQRCRRGGKTFMATAIAAILENHFNNDDQSPFIIFISMNQWSKLMDYEMAKDAILSRIAYELAQDERLFNQFFKHYSNFDAVEEWVTENDVVLLIDELNVIPVTRGTYSDMSVFLDYLAGRKGSALLCTTHHRLEEDLGQGRDDEERTDHLSTRPHFWQPMPRFNAVACVRHMKRTEQFWSAVLRGRIPALLVLPPEHIEKFMPVELINNNTRGLMFDAILDGDIRRIESGRSKFRAYAYLLKKSGGGDVHVFPPFLCAQESVLGKNCPHLRTVLQSPDTNHPKAFEALAELAVALQLMSSTPRYRNIVPRHPDVSRENCIEATAIFEIEAEHQNINDLRGAVEERLENQRERYADVRQIVVIPQYSEFPLYDFFLFHRQTRRRQWRWNRRQNRQCTIAAGYQCKSGAKYPDSDHAAAREVKLSVWIEGNGPTTRRTNKSYGWTLLSREEHRMLLGESFFAALPPSDDDSVPCPYCNKGDFNFAIDTSNETV